jgi:hypothetical protein
MTDNLMLLQKERGRLARELQKSETRGRAARAPAWTETGSPTRKT